MKYTFILKYQLSEQNRTQDEVVERLGAAGCEDALVGIGQPGCIALEFIREAVSAEAALVSALEDIKGAIPSATLIEVVLTGSAHRSADLLSAYFRQAH